MIPDSACGAYSTVHMAVFCKSSFWTCSSTYIEYHQFESAVYHLERPPHSCFLSFLLSTTLLYHVMTWVFSDCPACSQETCLTRRSQEGCRKGRTHSGQVLLQGQCRSQGCLEEEDNRHYQGPCQEEGAHCEKGNCDQKENDKGQEDFEIDSQTQGQD